MADLYPFQEEGVRFLAFHRRAYLADKMGLGKTVQAVRAAEMVGAEHAQVVCPASAVPNWRHEIQQWDRRRGALQLWWEDPISYASLIRRSWRDWRPDLVILDEAHYCKSVSAKRSRAGLGLARRAVTVGGRAWLLSGTPMPNHPVELWAPIKALWPEIKERFGCTRKTQWRDTFCECRQTLYGLKPYAVKNGAALREALDDIMLRRTLDDVGLDLPPLRTDLVRLPRGGADLGEYEDFEEKAAVSEDGYTSQLRRTLGEAKAPLVARQIIEELDDGAYERVVVLYYHRNVRDALAEDFAEADKTVVGFGGETPQAKRQEAIESFQAGDADIFLAQQTAAGIAINLTAATEIVLVEPAWSPNDNRQAIDRIHRIGQDQPCRARIFALSGTLDEAIMGTIQQKIQMQREVGL